MIRYRVVILIFASSNFLITSAEDAPQIAEDKISNAKPPEKVILLKSKPYSQADGFIDTISNWIKNPLGSDEQKSSEDLTAAASEYIGTKYLPPAKSFRGYSRSCYECNSEPWIPIAGRSLQFPPSYSHSTHSNSLEDNSNHYDQPYFKEKHGNKKQFNLHHPPIDQYGAPQATFDFPPVGEVVDFMLPPPYKSGNIISGIGSLYGTPSGNYGPPKPTYHQPQAIYGSPKPSFGRDPFNSGHQKPAPPVYRAPLPDISPPPSGTYRAPSDNYGPPPTPHRNYGLPSSNYRPPSLPLSGYGLPSAPTISFGPPSGKQFPTTHLRPVSQDFQPPLPGGGIHTLPLENNLPPAVPSDSYGRPISDHKLPSAPPSDSYGSPIGGGQHGYVEPITLGSGDSEDYGKRVAFNSHNHFQNFESQHSAEIKASLLQKGLTDVQVVPSVRIADYTASIEHPINLIQSPILDLNVKDQESLNQHFRPLEDSNEPILSQNPIVVDDTFTSASNINSTYSSGYNSTAIKRNNDKFLRSEPFGSRERLKDSDLTDSLIQKLIFEHNIIEDPNTQIVGIEKTIINPQKVSTNLNLVQPSIDYSSWTPAHQPTLPTIMVPPKPPSSTWLTPINESFVTAKNPKKLQIIVPYLKSSDNLVQWNNKPPAIYNREYTTLAPVFIPPPMNTESAILWTQFAEDIRTVESHKEPAHGFAKSGSTTEVYNIKDFLAKQQNLHQSSNNLPYDIISLQKNIDDWTHQAYSNRPILEEKITTKLAHVKEIPSEYLTTPHSYRDNSISSEFHGDFREPKDHLAASSNKKEFLSREIEDNLVEDTIATEKPAQTSTVASVRFIVREPKPSWETNKVTLSNSTHEKVYVVTPESYTQFQTSTPATAFSMAPRIQNGRVNNMPTMTRISVRVEAPSDRGIAGNELRPVKVVYSEWPHLINDLATTTTHRPTTRHPLFGLMDLAPYTVPPNATVETIGGHSKVTSVVTAPIAKHTSTTPMPAVNVNGTFKVSPV